MKNSTVQEDTVRRIIFPSFIYIKSRKICQKISKNKDFFIPNLDKGINIAVNLERSLENETIAKIMEGIE